jgi:HlyD family secretion protein
MSLDKNDGNVSTMVSDKSDGMSDRRIHVGTGKRLSNRLLKNKPVVTVVLSLLGLGLVTLALLVCQGAFGLIPAARLKFPVQSSGDQSTLLTVVQVQSVRVRVSASGTVTPEREVKISPKQAGLLKALYVDQGDLVKKGQLLAVMDDSNIRGQLYSQSAAYRAAQENYLKLKTGNRPEEIAQREAAYQQARSAVKAAEINVKKLESQLESQKTTSEKDSELARRDEILSKEGAASDQDYLKSRTQARVSLVQTRICGEEIAQAKENLAQSISALKQQREMLDLSRRGFRQEEIRNAWQCVQQQKGMLNYYETLVDDTKIKAPFDGQITQKYADGGSYVTPAVAAATDSATSSSIVVLAARLEVVAQVPESTIENISCGQEVEIVANAIKKARFHGIVTQIAPSAITSSNVTVFKVHVRLDDSACQKLRSGMNVTTTFLCGNIANARVIPSICVVTKDGKRGVYIVGADGRPSFRSVEMGAYLGEHVVVTSGLSQGEKVFKGLSDEELTRLGFSNPMKPPPFPGGPHH